MTGRTGIGRTRVQQRAAELDSVIGCRSANLIRASSLRAASRGRIDGGNRLSMAQRGKKLRAIAFQIWARTLARYASFHPARLILTRREPLDGSLRMRLMAMCGRIARL